MSEENEGGESQIDNLNEVESNADRIGVLEEKVEHLEEEVESFEEQEENNYSGEIEDLTETVEKIRSDLDFIIDRRGIRYLIDEDE